MEEGRAQAKPDRTNGMRLTNGAGTDTECRERGREEMMDRKGQNEKHENDVIGENTKEGTEGTDSTTLIEEMEVQEKMDVEENRNDNIVEVGKSKGEKGKHGNVLGTTKRSVTGRREGTNINVNTGGLAQENANSTTQREEFPPLNNQDLEEGKMTQGLRANKKPRTEEQRLSSVRRSRSGVRGKIVDDTTHGTGNNM
jgi:hypothetical protein